MYSKLLSGGLKSQMVQDPVDTVIFLLHTDYDNL